MRSWLIFSLLILCSPLARADVSASAQNVSPASITSLNLSVQGSLSSDQDIGCIPLKQVKNTFTPPDLYKGVSECISAGQYDLAVGLFMLAGTYGTFDAERVADKTAGQAKSVLIMNTFAPLTLVEKTKFHDALIAMHNNSDQFNALCNQIAKIGAPNYYPKYMILHGMKAFTGNPYDGALVADFDAENTWKNVQAQYLSFSKQ